MSGRIRAALYCRVSTAKQSAAEQERALRRFAEQRKWEVCGVFSDSTTGRSLWPREALDRLREDVRQAKIDKVLVWTVSRLGRSLSGVVAVMDEMFHSGVTLVAVGQEINSDTIMGRGVISLCAALAEADVEEHCRRVKEGIRSARAKGKRWGAP